MQIIHVYDSTGKELASRDLAGERKSLLVVTGAAGLELTETAPAEAEVLGALVPNEDGWSLAAVSVAKPVVAGPKSAPDMQLAAGTVCALGGYTFRMECDRGTTGAMLLWRYEGSRVVADPVAAGRNLVATSAVDARPAVNPALVGEELFEFFPSVNGIDVIAGTGNRRVRQQFDAGALFAVGGFEGMYLSGKDAEAAMKTSSPFAWPSRKPRLRLFVGLYLLAGLFAGAACLSMQVKKLQQAADAPRGAVQVSPMWNLSKDDDVDLRKTMFELKFYQSLPQVLQREPSLVAADLIRTGLLPEFTNNAAIARSVKFLRDVTDIQQLIKGGRWEELETTLSRVDRRMFTHAEADAFYDDAKEVSAYVNDVTPRFIDLMLTGEYLPARDLPRWNAAYVALTNQNIFFESPGLQYWVRADKNRIAAVKNYCKVRADVAKAGDAVDADGIAAAHRAFVAMTDCMDADSYEGVVSNELVKVCRWIRETGDRVVKRACDATKDDEVVGVLLMEVADFAEHVGLDPAVVNDWRKLAKDAARRLDARLRSLYQEYRITSTSDLEGGKRILAEMIRISSGGNRFGVWARHERARLAEKAQEKGVDGK